MTKKLDNLNAIAAFNQSSMIDGFLVSVPTARAILMYYSRLSSDLKKSYLNIPVDRMARIAGVYPTGASILTVFPEPRALLPYAERAYQDAEKFEKKYVEPFIKKTEKDVDAYFKKNKKYRGIIPYQI